MASHLFLDRAASPPFQGGEFCLRDVDYGLGRRAVDGEDNVDRSGAHRRGSHRACASHYCGNIRRRVCRTRRRARPFSNLLNVMLINVRETPACCRRTRLPTTKRNLLVGQSALRRRNAILLSEEASSDDKMQSSHRRTRLLTTRCNLLVGGRVF